MFADLQACFAVKRAGGDGYRVTVKAPPEQDAAAILTKATFGLIGGFEPFETLGFEEGHIIAFGICGRDKITGLLAALRAMACHHFAHWAVDLEPHVTTQTPARQMFRIACHIALPSEKNPPAAVANRGLD